LKGPPERTPWGAPKRGPLEWAPGEDHLEVTRRGTHLGDTVQGTFWKGPLEGIPWMGTPGEEHMEETCKEPPGWDSMVGTPCTGIDRGTLRGDLLEGIFLSGPLKADHWTGNPG
jgi:hypothetical protein